MALVRPVLRFLVLQSLFKKISRLPALFPAVLSLQALGLTAQLSAVLAACSLRLPVVQLNSQHTAAQLTPVLPQTL